MSMTNRKEAVYMARLAKCSVEELMSLKAHVAAHKGQMRYGAMMLKCITIALMAKVGLE